MSSRIRRGGSPSSRQPGRPKHLFGELPAALVLALLSATCVSRVDAFSASFVTPLHLAARRAVLPERTTPTYSNSSQAVPTISNSTTTNVGRYGHSAVFLDATNTLLFIGGQVGDNGTVVTADVLQFDLSSAFLWGPRPLSAIPNNPSAAPLLEAGLPPHAWAAAALDAANTTWLIGGVTQNCELDRIAYTLAAAGSGAQKGWSSPHVSPHAPPRRRQAQAVPVFNRTTSGADLYVFGGIAERYTCSEETIGYFGIDRWDTVGSTVETLPWNDPANWSGTYDPPVSDYTATLLADKASIVIIGGQTASGDLVGMRSVQVFNTSLRSWLSKNTTGPVPEPRMGHVAIALPSGAILVHGGVGADGTPVDTVNILTPPTDLAAAIEPWTWSTAYLGTHSLAAPARAWHTATLTPDGTIVVAFGIDDKDGSPSADLFFLRLDAQHHCTWNNTFTPPEEVKVYNPRLSLPVKAIANPKAAGLASQTPIAFTPPPSTYTSPVPTYHSSSVLLSFASPSASLSSSTLEDPSQQSKIAAAAATAKKRSIGVSVGSLVGVAAVLCLAGMLLRRRFSRKQGVQLNSPALSFAAPLVSTLLYTRPVARRRLSLGSTVSEHASPFADDRGAAGIGEAAMSRDPFSDAHVVNEMGQLHRAPSMTAQNSVASVMSVPYLHTVHRTHRSRDDDSFTSLPRSLRSIRSERDELNRLRAGEEWDLFDDHSMTPITGVSRKVSQASMFSTPQLPFPSFPESSAQPPILPRARNSLSVRNADPFRSP